MNEYLRILTCTAAVTLLFAFPTAAFGALRITEIMYDPPGSNAGHQWIQITNEDELPQNMFGYKLSQNGTNHGLTITQGTTTLSQGEVAILASNPQTFLADYPQYTGTLFKASFSLRASGDSMTLRDSKLNDLDTESYSAGDGASGDGNALYFVGGDWVSGRPDPLMYHRSAPEAIAAKSKTSVVSSAKPKSSKAQKSSKSVSGAHAGTGSGNYADSSLTATSELAAAQPVAAQSSSLIEIVAGSVAFGLVVVAGTVLSTRFAPKSEAVTISSESELQSNRVRSEADEYDIVESPQDFI